MTLSVTIKRWAFWAHLAAGLLAALFIFVMAFTGFLLTYERQLVELDEMRYSTDVGANSSRLTTDDVVNILQKLHPDEPHIYVRQVNRSGAAIPAWAGPNAYLIHPVNGTILRTGEGMVAGVFHWITRLHRYLLFAGEYRVIGKSITAYANLVLIFLLISGLYLWLPKRMSFAALKQHGWLPARYTNQHHRRHKRHLVFGVWSLPVIFIIAITATLFHFPWANTALYGFFGEPVPEREHHESVTSLHGDTVEYETLFKAAQRHASNNGYENWYSMWMEIGEHQHEARFYIDKSIGHRQSLAYSLYFDTRTGAVTNVLRKQDWSAGGQAWGTARFLHTGEHFGVAGQTVAGGVSLLTCYLVYSGFMLALKRFKFI